MRKLLTILSTVSFAVLISSCSKLPADNSAAPDVNFSLVEKTFTGTVQGVQGVSRTSLSGTSIVWSDTDDITVFSPLSGTKFTVASVSGGGSVCTWTGLAGEASEFYAVYPEATATYSSSIAGTIEGIVIPAEQTAIAGSFADRANPSIAHANDGSEQLLFKNVGALLSFSVEEAGITRVILTANEDIAGTATVTWNGGNPTASITSGSKSIALSGTFEVGETYYFVLYPGSYTGLKLEFQKIDRFAKFSSSYEPVIARNANIGMGSIPVPPAKWVVDNWLCWNNGGSINIGGTDYSKVSTAYDGSLLIASAANTALKASLSGKQNAFFLEENPGCNFSVDNTIEMENILVIGRYPASRPTVKITNKPFSNMGGYSCYKDLIIDASGQTGNYSFNWNINENDLLCFDDCKVTMANATKYGFAGPGTLATCHPPHSVILKDSDFFSSISRGTLQSGEVCEVIKLGGSPLASDLQFFSADNNIFYSTDACQFCILSLSATGADYSGHVDVSLTNNTIYNTVVRTGYALGANIRNLTVTGNIVCTPSEATLPDANSKPFARSYAGAKEPDNNVTPTGTINISDNIVYYTSSFRGYAAGSSISKVATPPILPETVAGGAFTPIAAYTAYGAQR